MSIEVISKKILQDQINAHIETLDKNMKEYANQDRFEFCKDLKLIKKGLEYALEHVNSSPVVSL